MYHFKRMVESVRTYGIGTENMTGPDEAQFLAKQFFDVIDQCQHFVFRAKEKDAPTEMAPTGTGQGLDAPFKVFSIEIAGQNSFITSPFEDDEYQTYVTCLVAAETTPRNYICFAHVHQGSKFYDRSRAKERVIVYPKPNGILGAFIDRLNSDEIGTQKVKERIKIGSGASKRTVEVRRITYVSPKKHTNDVQTVYGGVIDWSHRWFVRGHWRTLSNEGIGKDRAGDYCVPGQTWVKEHEKGNPDQDPMNKVRLV
jgi:hypothetical protein